MPLPEKAYEYLATAISSLKLNGGFVHYYDTTYSKKGAKSVNIIAHKVDERMNELGINYTLDSSRIVRMVGPNWYQVVLDLKILS